MDIYRNLELRQPSEPVWEEPAYDDPFANRERLGKLAGVFLIASILIMGFVGFCLAHGIANEQAAIDRNRV